MCDCKYRFSWFSYFFEGSSHDALARTLSRLEDWMKNDDTPGIFWVAEDEGYACKHMVITPYSSSLNQDKIETEFNYSLSSDRVPIEQVFGMLVSKRRILLKKLNYSVRNVVLWNLRFVYTCDSSCHGSTRTKAITVVT